jgi:hypothetical protein
MVMSNRKMLMLSAQGAPIAGYLLEAFGGAEGGLEAFRPAMFYAGSLGMASCALVLAARMKHSKMPLSRL